MCSFQYESFHDYFKKWPQQFEKRQIYYSGYLEVVLLQNFKNTIDFSISC